MDWLRRTALKENVPVAEKGVSFFHAAFLDSVRTHGRVHELSMMAHYKMKTRRYFDDMKLGWRMFTRGKLRIFPSNIKRKKEVAGLFTGPGP
jgi:heterodisulfide reductase subunit C